MNILSTSYLKKFLIPNIDTKQDYKYLLLHLTTATELGAILIFFLLLVLELIIDKNPINIILILISLVYTLSLRFYNPKNINIKINLFILLISLVCIYSSYIGLYFFIWFLFLMIYIAFHKGYKTSYLSLVLSCIIILIVVNFGEVEYKGVFYNINGIYLPKLIFIYFIVSVFTIIVVRNTSLFIHNNADLSVEQSTKLLIEHAEQVKLIERLKEEATIREKTQEKLEFSKFRYKTIFDNVLDYIVIHKKDGQIVGANNAAIEKYGFDKNDLFSYNKYDFITEKYLKLKDDRVDLAISQESLVFESEHIDKNGNTFKTENKLKVVVVDNEEYFVTICRDITDRKKKEEKDEEIKEKLTKLVEDRTAQLEDAMNELRMEIKEKSKTEIELLSAKNELIESLKIEKEFSELKSRFVSMISHEYRTPLTVILSTSYLLEHYFRSQDEEKFSNGLFKIQKSVQSMTLLLEDVLKIGKSENDVSKVTFNSVDIIDLANEIVKEIKFIDKTNHNFICICNYKSLTFSTDEKLMNHILKNIIHNAAKYSGKDTTITMSLEVVNNTMKIVIIDEGIGIPEEDLNQLFEPFFRSGNVGAIEGTGLGLSIVKRYVEALNGKIEVESEENVGSTFKMTFPLGEYEVVEKETLT